LHKPNKKNFYLLEQKKFLVLGAQFAIQAQESGKLTYKQIESCRRALRRGLGKTSKIIFHIFTSIPVSKKSVASRMGKVRAAFHIE
jgi:ribosomal protein L16/L10AE